MGGDVTHRRHGLIEPSSGFDDHRCLGEGNGKPSFCRLSKCRSRDSQAFPKAAANDSPLVIISGMSRKLTLYGGFFGSYSIEKT